MKTKFIALVIIAISVAMMIFIVSCDNGNEDVEPILNEQTEKNSMETYANSYTHEFESPSNTESANDIGGGDLGLLKYRMKYYNVPAPFAELVESDSFESWYSEIVLENPSETNIMVMKKFVQHFNISREDFDKANLKWAKIIVTGFDGKPMMNPKDFANQETDEVYNADIIYTFDDEIINNYYLSREYPYIYESEFEEAVASGEYTSQTEEWIDVEQMEAEIIAKYGEAEIVPEESTIVSEEKIETATLIPEEIIE